MDARCSETLLAPVSTSVRLPFPVTIDWGPGPFLQGSSDGRHGSLFPHGVEIVWTAAMHITQGAPHLKSYLRK